eukprot:gene1062-4294_t
MYLLLVKSSAFTNWTTQTLSWDPLNNKVFAILEVPSGNTGSASPIFYHICLPQRRLKLVVRLTGGRIGSQSKREGPRIACHDLHVIPVSLFLHIIDGDGKDDVLVSILVDRQMIPRAK